MLAEFLIGWAISNQFGGSSKSSKSSHDLKEEAKKKKLEMEFEEKLARQKEYYEKMKREAEAFGEATAAARRQSE